MAILLLTLFPIPSPSDDVDTESKAAALVEKQRHFFISEPDIGQLVETTNLLRNLGKDKCIKLLRKCYWADKTTDEMILLYSRLLFENPKGWKAPNLGDPIPKFDPNAAKQFPLFPLAISDGIPFLLPHGYSMGGRPESGIACLVKCEEFKLIEKAYATSGFELAATKLLKTEAFDKLYQTEKDKKRMSEMIMKQAKTEKDVGK